MVDICQLFQLYVEQKELRALLLMQVGMSTSTLHAPSTSMDIPVDCMHICYVPYHISGKY